MLGAESWPTLLGGGRRFLLGSADRVPEESCEFPMAVEFLGSTPPLGTRIFALGAIFGCMFVVLTGLEVLRHNLPPAILLDFCSRFCMAGGSCFIGLS